MNYTSILTGQLVQIETKRPAKKRASGCNGCPREKTKQKELAFDNPDAKVLVWSLRPEDGVSGDDQDSAWFWKRFTRYSGIKRRDCSEQYVVRCASSGEIPEPPPGTKFDHIWVQLQLTPSRDEVSHCNFHNYNARKLSQARVWVVVGRKTRDILFPGHPKDSTVFWSERDGVRVFTFDTVYQMTHSDWRYRDFRLKCRMLKDAIEHGASEWDWLKSKDFGMLYRPESVKKFLAKLVASGHRISADIEVGKSKSGKKITLCIGFSNKRDYARTVVLDHPENPATKKERRQVWRYVKSFLADRRVKKTFHFGASDTTELAEINEVKVRRFVYDTMYASFLARSYRRKHGLGAIANDYHFSYSGYKAILNEHLLTTKNYAKIPLRVLCLYNSADAALTYEIDESTSKVVSEPLVYTYVHAGKTLYRMQDVGPKIDTQYIAKLQEFVPAQIEKALRKLRMYAGDPNFDPNKNADVIRLIYKKLRLRGPEQDRKTGAISYPTDEKVLKELALSTKHPVPTLVMDYRRYYTMLSRYILPYEQSAKVNDGELRTIWHLTGAVTGRLRSGGRPEYEDSKTRILTDDSADEKQLIVNLQNIHGQPLIQNILVSDPDWKRLIKDYPNGRAELEDLLDTEVMLALDYSQIEIRMLAEVSQDPKLISHFASGEDSHCLVGHNLTGMSVKAIREDKKVRRFIKALHFGIVYGLTPAGLHRNLAAEGIDYTFDYVETMYEKYFTVYRNVRTYMDRMLQFSKDHGYVETIFKFRRYIGSDYDEDRDTSPENQAKNAPIQGAAHQLMINALALLSLKPKRYNLLNKPIMEVHDALVFRVKLRNLRQAFSQVRQLLEKDVIDYTARVLDYKIQVPLLAEASVGVRYGELVEYDSNTIKQNGGHLPPVKKIVADLIANHVEVKKKTKDKFGFAA